MRVLGVDGCRPGWVGVLLTEGRVAGVVARATVAALVEEVGPVDVVGIDIPIGLPRSGVRAADLAAQRFLGARRSTVFSTPIAEALRAGTLAEAIAVSRLRTGRGISAQAFALRARILEVAAWLPTAGVDGREVHPEVSFAVMSGAPLPASKRTWPGRHSGWRAARRSRSPRHPRTWPSGRSRRVSRTVEHHPPRPTRGRSQRLRCRGLSVSSGRSSPSTAAQGERCR